MSRLSEPAPRDGKRMDPTRARGGDAFAGLIGKLSSKKLWGHSARGLVWNPIFALLPWFYLNRFAASTGLPSAFWLSAFVLGFPHAGYTAAELRHYTRPNDGIADGQTWSQLAFFLAYGLVGGALAVWYVASGAGTIGARFGWSPHVLMPALALAGSVGAVMGLQDVLVVDLAVRPIKVAQAALASLLQPRLMKLTIPWAATQCLMAEALHAL